MPSTAGEFLLVVVEGVEGMAFVVKIQNELMLMMYTTILFLRSLLYIIISTTAETFAIQNDLLHIITILFVYEFDPVPHMGNIVTSLLICLT